MDFLEEIDLVEKGRSEVLRVLLLDSLDAETDARDEAPSMEMAASRLIRTASHTRIASRLTRIASRLTRSASSFWKVSGKINRHKEPK